jgi:hypothetical protein
MNGQLEVDHIGLAPIPTRSLFPEETAHALVALLLLLFTVGACVDPEEPSASEDKLSSTEGQSLSSSFPMGFARVYAAGTLRTYFNSAGGAVSVSHATGNYTVTFAGLKSNSGDGHVQVTAEGTNDVRCRIAGWSYQDETYKRISVQCNAPDGSLADSAFAVLFFRHTMPGVKTSWATKAYTSVAAWGQVLLGADYNSSGTHNAATRSGPGAYIVSIPNATTINASMMISSYGGAAGNVCSILSWTSESARIECRDRLGTLVDSTFTLSYEVDWLNTQQGGHTWFDGMEANPAYTGGVAKWQCSSRSVSGSRNDSRASIVVSGELGSWDGGPFRRASLVSKYGSAGYCKVESLSNVEGATSTSTTVVRCYSATGTVITVPQFTFTQVTSDPGMAPC